MTRLLWRLSLVGAVASHSGVLAGGLFGAEREIEVSLQSPAVTWRADAPLPLIVTASHRGAGVVDGRFELRLSDGRRTIGTVRTAEVALANAEQSYRVVVPPLRGGAGWSQLSARIRFVGDESEVDLGEHLLFLAPRTTDRQHLVGVCVTESAARATARITRGLRLGPLLRRSDWKGVLTLPWPVEPSELSADPLQHCLYDVLVVDASRLDELSPEQHRALGGWVKAGGRLFVVARLTLSRRNRAFLEDLERSGRAVSWPAEKPAERIRPGGGLDPDSASREEPAGTLQPGDLRLLRSGLGRVVVALRMPSEDDILTTRWREAAAFLWNFRKADAKRVAELPPRRPNVFRRFGSAWPAPPAALPNGSVDESEPALKWMISSLLPSEIHVIPPVTIGVILAAFAFVVGPLDYLILGLFRRRRFTWLLFPTTCVAFSLGTLRLSEAHLGAQDVRRTMTFVDIGRGGEVLRTSRYRLFFDTGGGQRTSEGANEILTLCRSGESAMRRGAGFGEDETLVYEGRFPGRYSMSYPVRQWTPYLERRFRLAPKGDVPDLDWDALDALDGTESLDRRRVRELLIGGRVTDCSVFLLYRNSLDLVEQRITRDFWSVLVETQLFKRPARRSRAGDLESARPCVGPSGGPGIRDLPLLDTTSLREFLVVAVREEGGDLIFYRRLYHGVEP